MMNYRNSMLIKNNIIKQIYKQQKDQISIRIRSNKNKLITTTKNKLITTTKKHSKAHSETTTKSFKSNTKINKLNRFNKT